MMCVDCGRDASMMVWESCDVEVNAVGLCDDCADDDSVWCDCCHNFVAL